MNYDNEIDSSDYVMHKMFRYIHYDHAFLLLRSVCMTILLVYDTEPTVDGTLLLMLFATIALCFVLFLMMLVVRLFTRRITILHDMFALMLFPIAFIAVSLISTFEAIVDSSKYEKLPEFMSDLMVAVLTKNTNDYVRTSVNYDIGIKLPIAEEYNYHATIMNKYHILALALLYLFVVLMSLALNTPGTIVFVFVMLFAHIYRIYIYYKRYRMMKYSLFNLL